MEIKPKNWILLLGLAATLLLTNPRFELIDDEAYQVGSAAQPIAIVASAFASKTAQFHPPLPDILLHYWIVLTNCSLALLRLPSILFFTLGIWIASLAAGKVAGPAACRATIVVGILWPYGFHFGRFAVWLPFCFFLVSSVTYAYLAWIERSTPMRFLRLLICALALVYTNFMGWLFLAILAADLLFRRERSRTYWLISAVFILVALYIPVWPQFIQLVRAHPATISARTFLTFFYSLYVLIASESIAPWVLPLSIPLALSILACGIIILFKSSTFARTLCASALLLSLSLALSGEMNQKRVMPLAAWFLISAGIALAKAPPPWRRFLSSGLIIIGAISWFGILSPRFYSTPRSREPWQQIAHIAADAVLSHQIVIGSHPAFLLYLTRDLMFAEGFNTFRGNYGEQLQRQDVYNVAAWIDAGHPTSPHMLFVGTMYGTDFQNTINASAWLDRRCSRESTESLVNNPEYKLKGRLFGSSQAWPWRIEVHRYNCQT